MVNGCRTIEADAGSLSPALLDRMKPGETDILEHDFSEDVDCKGDGVTITQAVPSIHPDDDDGLLTLGATVIDGLEVQQFVSANVDPTQRNYMITMRLTLSDGRVLDRDVSLPVLETRRANA